MPKLCVKVTGGIYSVVIFALRKPKQADYAQT